MIAASRHDGGGMQLRSEGSILGVTLPVGLVTVGIIGEFHIKGEQKKQGQPEKATTIGGGFKDFLCSTLPGEDEPSLTYIFQMGWNHQLDKIIKDS